MFRRLALVSLVVACGGKSVAPSGDRQVTKGFDAPLVTVKSAVVIDAAPPPVLVMLDATGRRSLAAAASWTALSAGQLVVGPKPAGDDASAIHLAEGITMGRDPKTIVDTFVDFRTGREDGGDRATTTEMDDPPPPEEEDRPDDGDESGGTGTAMDLEEGKIAREQAIEAARAAGILGSSSTAKGSPRGRDSTSWRDGDVERQAAIVGEVTGAPLQDVPAVIVAAPAARAEAVVKAVAELEAMIGVRVDGEIRPLRIQFQRDRTKRGWVEKEPWVEVRIDAAHVTVEAVPSTPTVLAWSDVARLASTVGDVRAKRKLPATSPVDVLVAPDLDAQHLVDVLVALEGGSVTWIGLGFAPVSKQLAVRGHEPAPIPAQPAGVTVAIGAPNTQGDLDKEVIRRAVKLNIQKIQYCYEKELLAKPTLRGTVMVQFFIGVDGKVATASGAGMDPEVASCVAGVIKGIEFPRPKGGGGVQVNYPFTFRPETGDKK